MLALLMPVAYARPKSKPPALVNLPHLEMDGGRRLAFERSFNTQKEVKPKRGQVINLMDALRKSVSGDKAPAAEKSEKKRGPQLIKGAKKAAKSSSSSRRKTA